MTTKISRILSLVILPLMLSGCGMVVLDPAGYVAARQRDLLVATTVLMLLIIIPVIVAICIVAWRYRESNKKAAYAPEWEHSTILELLMWSVPLAIIIAIGAITWIGTHTLDPYHPLTGKPGQIAKAPTTKALHVDVVSMDWKWLFIYPDYGIATVNRLVAPKGVPIKFNLTSTNMMNSFFIPALAGQIYVMAGMQTKLHGFIDKTGTYKGISSNYSGKGFSEMDFKFIVKNKQDFHKWVTSVKHNGKHLTRSRYKKLAQPSVNNPVRQFATYTDGLYHDILHRYMNPKLRCNGKTLKLYEKCDHPTHVKSSE